MFDFKRYDFARSFNHQTLYLAESDMALLAYSSCVASKKCTVTWRNRFMRIGSHFAWAEIFLVIDNGLKSAWHGRIWCITATEYLRQDIQARAPSRGLALYLEAVTHAIALAAYSNRVLDILSEAYCNRLILLALHYIAWRMAFVSRFINK